MLFGSFGNAGINVWGISVNLSFLSLSFHIGYFLISHDITHPELRVFGITLTINNNNNNKMNSDIYRENGTMKAKGRLRNQCDIFETSWMRASLAAHVVMSHWSLIVCPEGKKEEGKKVCCFSWNNKVIFQVKAPFILWSFSEIYAFFPWPCKMWNPIASIPLTDWWHPNIKSCGINQCAACFMTSQAYAGWLSF